MSAAPPALGPDGEPAELWEGLPSIVLDAELAALWAAYSLLRTLPPRTQCRALSWLGARLNDEADRAAGGAAGWGRGRPHSPSDADIPF